MKNFLPFIWVVLVVPVCTAETHIQSGELAGTWDLAGSPYIIEGNCLITVNSTLTIEPGVQVLMEPGNRIRCEGQLLAVGTEDHMIVFTATDESRGCEGLDFVDTDLCLRDSSKLVYCEISHGVGALPGDMYQHGGGIFLRNSSRVLISHCLITNNRTRTAYGQDGLSGQNPGESGQPGETAISAHGGAIYCENSNPSIRFCDICYNYTGDACGGNGGYGVEDITSSTPASGGTGGHGGDGKAGFGGAIYLNNSGAILYGNRFYGNYTGTGHGGYGGSGGNACSYNYSAEGGHGGRGGYGYGGCGGAIYTTLSTNTFKNNIIYGNRTGFGHGGDGGNGGDALGYSGCTPGCGGHGGNGRGGIGFAVFSNDNTWDVYVNCTFTDQVIPSVAYNGAGGTHGNNTGNAGNGQIFPGTNVVAGDGLLIMNSILWGNIQSEIENVAIFYSCVQNGYTGVGNMDADPLFVDPANHDYHLQSTVGSYHGGGWLPDLAHSPCIDAGDPDDHFDMEPMPNGGRINMGAYGNTAEASLSTAMGVAAGSSEIPLEFGLHPNYPNPFNATTVISFQLSMVRFVNLAVYDVSGGLVAELVHGWRDAGVHEVTFDGSGLASGVYVYQLTVSSGSGTSEGQATPTTVSGKMVFMK
jgi:hypothetical protein